MKFPFSIKTEAEFDVVGFGTNAVDFLISVPEYPKFDSKVELTKYVQAAGGEVASTLVGLQRLGMTTSYIGSFGTDSAGEFGYESLVKEGVELSNVRFVEGASTQIAFIVIDESSGERTVLWKRDEQLKISVSDAPLYLAEKTRLLHLTPHDTSACLALAKAAKDSKTVVSIDVDNFFVGLTDVLMFVDVLIASSDFSAKIYGEIEKKKALKNLKKDFGCAVVGMTLGARGSIFLCGDEFIKTKGFSVPGGCRDTTGAGDAFRTGFLYGLLCGDTVSKAAEKANAVAALKCRAIGARTSLPTSDELHQFLSV
ncbi:MAG: carbohydrate kinase family protein [Pyrinomonadaceae bacterium]